ncbi:MAG TPA: PAS domain S-box protein, partial [Bacteroidota bacterium]|nr:PAS domain S-box protein [Bacteroidota bacterium]
MNKRNILLVEDDAIIAASESSLLRSEGYEVLLALSGEKAVQTVRAQGGRVDLILMDVDLGKGMDGTQAAQEILREFDIPVLFLSSHTEKEVVDRTEKITSYGYVVKDSGDIVLLASIRMAFKLHEANRELQAKEHSLRESEDRYRRLVEFSPDAIAVHRDGKFIYANPATVRLLRAQSETQLIGTPVLDIVHQDFRSRVRERISMAIGEDKAMPWAQERLVCLDGTEMEVEIASIPILFGGAKAVCVVARGITERMQAEEALRESEERFRLVVANSPDQIFYQDRDLRYSWVADPEGSPEASTKVGKTDFDFFEMTEAERIVKLKRRVLETGVGVRTEVHMVQQDGSRKLFEGFYEPRRDANGKIIGLTGYLRDISDRERARDAMRVSEERYRLLAENSHDLICELNADGIFQYVNARYQSLLGYSPGELIGTSPFVLVHPDDVDTVIAEFRSGFMQEEPRTLQLRFRGKHGGYHWFESVGKAYVTDSGERRAVVVSREITAAKRTRELLEASERSYRGLFNTIGDAIYVQDKKGAFLDVNDGAVTMYGYPREYFIGKTPEFLSAPGMNDLSATARAIQEAFGGKPQQFLWWGVRRSGEVFPKEVQLKRGTYFGRDAIIAVARDITDRKRVEERLAISENQYRTLVEGMSEALMQVDNDDRITFVNQQFCDLVGYSREEVLGRNGQD